MQRIKLLLVFVSMTLLISMASTASADGPGNVADWLIRPGDLVAFGSTHILVPENLLVERTTSVPGSLSGWAEAHSISILVSSVKPGGDGALITSRSYKFQSSEAARAAFFAAQDPGKAFSWVTKAEGASLLEGNLINLLDRHSALWRAWHGVDNEGLPAYALWIQDTLSVAEVQITVGFGQEAMGKKLVDRVIRRLVDENTGGVPSTGVSIGKPTPSAPPGPSPQWWYSGSRAYTIEDAGNWEYLAVWSQPYGYGPHFVGSGGDGITCTYGGEHGCIGNWTWWQSSPQSKLGVPKTFLIGWGCCGAWDANNYSATVWIN